MTKNIDLDAERARLQDMLKNPQTDLERAIKEDWLTKGSEPREWSDETIHSAHWAICVYELGWNRRADTGKSAQGKGNALSLTPEGGKVRQAEEGK